MKVFATRDPLFRKLLDLAHRAADTSANVFLTGESGTGKSRLARLIHDSSRRSGEKFVEVPCANLPADLVESVLFGHERGAFTGAESTHEGRFEKANHGTLFLDEIQELLPELQAKVLRAIEEKRFERLGGNQTIEVDLRIIACTSEDPDNLVARGRLRRDLFYRLNVVRIDLPPLRNRACDIPILAEELLRDLSREHGLGPRRLGAEALERCRRHPWPGNVRELRHALESAAILAEDEEISGTDLPSQLSMTGPGMLRSAAANDWTLDMLETAYIREVLTRTGGNKSAAARILGIHRKTLHDKLRRMKTQ